MEVNPIIHLLPDKSQLMLLPFKSKIFSIYFCVKYGSWDLKTSKDYELAHFLEHLFCEMTSSKYPDGKKNQIMMKNHGIVYNASTYPYRTVYMYEGLNKGVDLVIDMLINAYVGFQIDHQIFLQEKKAVMNELMGHMSDPFHILNDAFQQYMFRDNEVLHNATYPLRYKNSARLTGKEVIDAWKKHYHGKNVLFCIAGGGFDAEIMTKHFTKTLRKVMYNRTEAIPPVPFYKPARHEKITVIMNGTKSTAIRVLWHSNIKWYDYQHTVMLQTLNHLMVGGLLGRLWMRLRMEEGLIYSINGSTQFNDHMEEATYGYETLVEDKEQTKKVIAIITEECESFSKVTKKELESVKNTLLYTFEETAVTSSRHPSDIIENHYKHVLWGVKSKGLKEKKRIMKKITAEQLTAFARSIFIKNARITFLGLPSE